MSAPEPVPGSPAIDPVSDAEIWIDLKCLRCQYSLRGLRPSGRCPECGVPVQLSLQSHLLEFSDPAWIGRLASGGRIVIGALAAFIVLSVPITASATANYRHFQYVVWLGWGLLAALTVGVWKVTTPNPAMSGSERWYALRKGVRVSLVVMCLVCLVHLLGPQLGVAPQTRLVAHAIAGPLGVLGLMAFSELAAYARDLARRLGERRVVAHSARVQLILTFAWAGMAISLSLLAVGGVFGRPDPDAPAVIGALCGLGYVVAAVLTLALPAQLVEPFRRCRAAAEANWAAALAASTGADGGAAPADATARAGTAPAGSSAPAPDDTAARP